MWRKCALIIFLVATLCGLAPAQTAGATTKDQGTTSTCTLNPTPTPAPTPGDIKSVAKARLEKKWRDTKTLQNTLDALSLYIEGGPKNARDALGKLVAGEGETDTKHDRDLYLAAQGVPDEQGQPRTQGLSNFLDLLATANTCGDITPGNRKDLFTRAESIIGNIFFDDDNDGKQSLVRINSLLVLKDNYRALLELLSAEEKREHKTTDDDTVSNLEILRAAFNDDVDRLANKVAARIAPKK